MSAPVLRLARPEDIPAIEALLTAEWLPPFQIREFLETFWVLDEEGRVLGAAGLEDYGEAGVIRSVVVHPSARGRRLGDLLSRTAIGEARRRGLQRLYLFTGDKAPFWRRFGFEPCTMADFEPAARRSWQFVAISERPEIARMVTPMRANLDHDKT
ncbi:MAG: GNAT family N-acetyltransferase [Dehalococcoidia bacterium]|nr:GNAT family N-acetyltransferase [Dehalococcoidia bacterium]